MNNFLNLEDVAEWVWKTLCGSFMAIIGYFLPIKDLVHLVIVFFMIDMMFGYWAASKLRGEKFSTQIVWRTTFPRMLISIILVTMAYMWDTTCHQEYLPTYNIIGWFISGILLFSIGKNAFKITNWEGFNQVSNLFQKKIKDQTGIDITEK